MFRSNTPAEPDDYEVKLDPSNLQILEDSSSVGRSPISEYETTYDVSNGVDSVVVGKIHDQYNNVDERIEKCRLHKDATQLGPLHSATDDGASRAT